jgi:hypothetical protein
MAGHTSEKRWRRNQTKVSGEGVSNQASAICTKVVATLLEAEQAFLEMQELYNYTGGTVTLLAEQLFKEDIEARSSPDNVANTEEIDKAQDLFDAMTAAHELYQAANNIAVAQEDRFAQLRRMS